ncbi:hypothetical protein K461DRAFT_33199 [Myriangium duriaei CBS 260.36]|uniref:Uncharacterized protein n=1 Tax=Myriangium duriaei CBS 260.36 TaxID=1168546 RepID=A0A9P4IWC2_9PEZI|nr:hypothetical protein K461DRAFT_33199 [Myriangium duriaei CBS 260.36]
MMLPERVAYGRKILSGIRSVKNQIGSCGIAFSIKPALMLNSPGIIDFHDDRRGTTFSTKLSFKVE